MGNRLEELIKEKERIDAEIMRLQHDTVSYGEARIGKSVRGYNKDKEYWSFSYHARMVNGERVWRHLFSDQSRDVVVAEIPKILEDLIKVYGIETDGETSGGQMIGNEKDLREFAEWVAHEVFADGIEDGTFTEVACRKLEKLGIVKNEGGAWTYDAGDNRQ